jgi:hypothetical protein
MAVAPGTRPTNPQVLLVRRYNRRFILVMAVYVLLVPISSGLVDVMGGSIWRYPVALLPVVPLLVAFWVFIIYLRQMDELLRRIQLEAFGISLGVTLVFTITWGFLEAADLVPHFPTILVGPLIILAWGFGSVISQRRYNAVCETD